MQGGLGVRKGFFDETIGKEDDQRLYSYRGRTIAICKMIGFCGRSSDEAENSVLIS